jgi:hypothetical protein
MLSGFAKFVYDRGCGLPRRQWDNDDAAAATSDIRRAHNRVFSIVSAFHDYVGLQMPDELQGSILAKHDDEIDLLDGGEDVRTLALTAYRSSRSLETPNGCIAVDADYERVGRLACGYEKINVSRVQQIEDPVGEGDASLPRRPPPLRLRPGCNFGRRNSGLQRFESTEVWK